TLRHVPIASTALSTGCAQRTLTSPGRSPSVMGTQPPGGGGPFVRGRRTARDKPGGYAHPGPGRPPLANLLPARRLREPDRQHVVDVTSTGNRPGCCPKGHRFRAKSRDRRSELDLASVTS